MKEKILSLPLRLRSAVYCAPLFISWIIGYSFESDARSLRAAGRGLVLFCWFLFARGVIFAVHEITKSFALYGYLTDLSFFAAKSLAGLAYLGAGLFLSIRELQDQPAESAAIDNFSNRLNGFLSR